MKLFVSYIIDLIFGDPLNLPHPIRIMGKTIIFMEDKFRKLPINLLLSGISFSITLIFSTWLITFLIIKSAYFLNPSIGIIIEIVLIYYCLSVKSLEIAAIEVYHALLNKNLLLARQKVSMIVGREVDQLLETGITRATVETVAENLVDGVISVLFYASIGGASLAMAYKMINTLDSMIGYKNERYIQFGKASAKIDDIVNYIPARISIIVISIAAHLLARNGYKALKTAFHEGAKHLSPNSGYPEAAFAGALGIKLGGPNYYHGKLVSKPYIGEEFENASININHIKKACDLMLLSSFLWINFLFFWKPFL